MKKALIVLLFLLIVVIGFGVYFLQNPSDSFYRSEFNRSTDIVIPSSAKLIAGCSNSYVTEAVYELDEQHWDDFLSQVKNVGKPGKLFLERECTPSIESVLGKMDTSSVVSFNKDQFSWKANSRDLKFYWKIEVD